MFHVKHPLNNEQLNKIEAYETLLKVYNETTNIYSKKSYDKLPFHIQDCINISLLCGDQEQHIIDLGSGSGLPSIILAICLPNASVTATESKGRKAAFLNLAKNELKLNNLSIINQNIHEWIYHSKPKGNTITAKAFANFEDCLKLAYQLTPEKGRLIIPISAAQANGLTNKLKKDEIIHNETLNTYYIVKSI